MLRSKSTSFSKRKTVTPKDILRVMSTDFIYRKET